MVARGALEVRSNVVRGQRCHLVSSWWHAVHCELPPGVGFAADHAAFVIMQSHKDAAWGRRQHIAVENHAARKRSHTFRSELNLRICRPNLYLLVHTPAC